ncbi:MAG: hypothetical protein OXJ52_02660, partial [Oligoflexia bacterium]|nr:hypothetical protein [Oligoflexia bacterium]
GNMINPVFTPWWEEPDLLQNLTLKAQENLLYPEKNKTAFGSKKNNILLHSALSGLNKTLNSPDKKHILTKHLNNMKFVKYEKGTGPDSFYKQVIEPLSKGLAIENIEIPFLTEVYKRYINEQSQLDFLSYLLARRDTFNNESEQTVVMPFEANSFSAKVITKYRDTLDEIEELRDRIDLPAVEELHKETLKQYSQTLHGVIEDHRLQR